MKKLLWLLFTPLLIGQIDVVNTTTQLSAHEGTGIIILNTPDSYGGIYTYIDSTYSEGTFAFAHPYTGKQWARLGAFANATFTTLTGSNAETIVNTTDGQFSFGNANLYTTGTLTAGSTTFAGGTLTSTLNADSNNIEYVDTLTGANAETISNSVNGQWSFGSANLLTSGTLDAGATTLTTITGTGTTILKTGTGGSSSDSSLVFTSATGAPLLTWYGTDGDAVAIGINTSDAMLFTGAVGGYSFSGEMAASDALTISTNGTKQFKLFDTDADDAQQPYWYLQNANNGSKGIFYLGYTNVSNNTSTDVMLVDSVSFTLGSVIGTGTKALYALSLNGYTPKQGMQLSDTTKYVLYSDTTSSVAMQWELDDKLNNADSTNFRTFSDLKYLENADSTNMRTFSDLKYLKNADSTSFRTFSDLKYLENGDSTNMRTFSDLKYLKNADSTSFRTFSDLKYLENGDSTNIRTFSDLKYLENGDSTNFRTFSDLKYLVDGDTTGFRTFSDLKYLENADSTAQTVFTDLKLAYKAPLASPTFTGTVTAPSVALTSYSTITNQNATNAANSDTLALGSDVSNLIKVRSSTSASDSVVYLTGGVANSYYQFKAVHTDTTITFADAINANLILGASRVLDADDDLLILFYDGTKWIEVAFSNNE